VKSLVCQRFLTAVILTNEAQAFRTDAIRVRGSWILTSTDLLTAQDVLPCCNPDRLPSMALSISRRARYGTKRQAETIHTRRGRSFTRLALMSRCPLIQPTIKEQRQIWQYQSVNYFRPPSCGLVRTLKLARGSAEYKTSIIRGCAVLGCRTSERRTYPWCWKRTILP
jgi:hypothetical protein